jgi:c-di-GMP-binding flagellar brake protein YcgR
MSRDDRSENYSCQVIGIGERRSLILSAPARDDRSYVAISEGQTWLFRTFYATAAIRFSGTVEKLVFEPFPYFHVEVPQIVEMRHVRKMQRVAVSMDAVINLENPQEAVIVDMSTTGMRLALPQDVKLEEGQRIKVDFRVQVLGEVHPLSVNATVVRCLGGADHMHPEVHFYGLGLEMASSMERLLLHAYVQGCLVNELDGLSKILAG